MCLSKFELVKTYLATCIQRSVPSACMHEISTCILKLSANILRIKAYNTLNVSVVALMKVL